MKKNANTPRSIAPPTPPTTPPTMAPTLVPESFLLGSLELVLVEELEEVAVAEGLLVSVLYTTLPPCDDSWVTTVVWVAASEDEVDPDVVVDSSDDSEDDDDVVDDDDDDDDDDEEDEDDVDVWAALELLLDDDDDDDDDSDEEELRLLESLLPSPLEPAPSYKLYTFLPPHISSPYPLHSTLQLDELVESEGFSFKQ